MGGMRECNESDRRRQIYKGGRSENKIGISTLGKVYFGMETRIEETVTEFVSVAIV